MEKSAAESFMSDNLIPCDICVYVEDADFPNVAVCDAPTKNGPWANMCEPHAKTHAAGNVRYKVAR